MNNWKKTARSAYSKARQPKAKAMNHDGLWWVIHVQVFLKRSRWWWENVRNLPPFGEIHPVFFWKCFGVWSPQPELPGLQILDHTSGGWELGLRALADSNARGWDCSAVGTGHNIEKLDQLRGILFIASSNSSSPKFVIYQESIKVCSSVAVIWCNLFQWQTRGPHPAADFPKAKSFIEHACGCVNGQCSCQDVAQPWRKVLVDVGISMPVMWWDSPWFSWWRWPRGGAWDFAQTTFVKSLAYILKLFNGVCPSKLLVCHWKWFSSNCNVVDLCRISSRPSWVEFDAHSSWNLPTPPIWPTDIALYTVAVALRQVVVALYMWASTSMRMTVCLRRVAHQFQNKMIQNDTKIYKRMQKAPTWAF